MDERLSELVSDIFFDFISEIEGSELYDEFIIRHKDHTESTERASELFYKIEDKIHDYTYDLLYDKERLNEL
tara:strand:+ start:562 stop:777 length:216 start_codon:yes stop_codon:yes gene_type:complete